MDEQLIEDLTNYLEDDAETARMIPLSVKRAIRSYGRTAYRGLDKLS
nr:MAG TPA: hypothetical protein [Caudoviricetes sp.]